MAGFDLGRILRDVETDGAIERALAEHYPRVLLRTPRYFRRAGDDKWTVRERRLCDLMVWVHDGKKQLVDGGEGHRWSKCDVRLLTDATIARLAAFDRALANLRRLREEYLRSVFFDLDPVSYETIEATRREWSEAKSELKARYGLDRKG